VSFKVDREKVEQKHSLRWSVDAKAHDISIEARFAPISGSGGRSDSGAASVLCPATRKSAQSDTFRPDCCGELILIFDNTYSWTRSKEVQYQIGWL